MEIVLEILSEIRPEFDFENSTNFIENGMLDSFDIITLVTELDEKFDISIDGLDILPENFNTLQQIRDLVIKSGGKL